jgi:hypothetical protein
MNHTHASAGATERQLAFPLAAWIMLAVIMVFAIAGGGQAQLRVIGSAFDPSTTAVSLVPKQRSLGAKPAIFQSGIPDVVLGSPPALAVAAYEAVTTAPVLFLRLWQPALNVALGRSRSLAKPLGARAPPRH